MASAAVSAGVAHAAAAGVATPATHAAATAGAAAPAAPATRAAAPTTPAIAVKGLRKSYGSTEVLKGIDLSVKAGEIFALLGSNGAGKTTTIRILATLLRPDGGTAEVCGLDV
ncbi:MAG: ATP-binding cassette domain-containing protein, partial [Coriobacteriales bacterium]|nr:ATP-binding cassette domain-containing protein [Coriobacteriales bacterium]